MISTGRATAAGAVDDDRICMIGHRSLDTRLEMAARDMNCAGDVAFLPFIAFTDVDEDHAVLGEVGRASGVNFLDFRLRLLEQVSIRAHCFNEYSGCFRR